MKRKHVTQQETPAGIKNAYEIKSEKRLILIRNDTKTHALSGHDLAVRVHGVVVVERRVRGQHCAQREFAVVVNDAENVTRVRTKQRTREKFEE